MRRDLDARWRRDPDDALDDEPSRSLDAAVLAKLGALAGIAGTVLLYDLLPAALALAVSAVEGLDVFAPFIDPAVHGRLGRLGLFLSAVAAVIACESLTRLGRPFGLPAFLATVAVLAAALFPSLAAAHRVQLGLAAEHMALLLAYAYLALKVTVGILAGAVVSWIIIGHRVSARRA
ncbi:MAG TPA: hypothetical protein VNN07_12325 [Candidatus Tectomicrobia bacterium]|nr:hypothetical protein [Candidatus Tectomicrobia bacterium]